MITFEHEISWPLFVVPLDNGCGLFWTAACAVHCASAHAPFPTDVKYTVFGMHIVDSYVLEQIVTLKEVGHSRTSKVFKDCVVT